MNFTSEKQWWCLTHLIYFILTYISDNVNIFLVFLFFILSIEIRCDFYEQYASSNPRPICSKQKQHYFKHKPTVRQPTYHLNPPYLLETKATLFVAQANGRATNISSKSNLSTRNKNIDIFVWVCYNVFIEKGDLV